MNFTSFLRDNYWRFSLAKDEIGENYAYGTIPYYLMKGFYIAQSRQRRSFKRAVMRINRCKVWVSKQATSHPFLYSIASLTGVAALYGAALFVSIKVCTFLLKVF